MGNDTKVSCKGKDEESNDIKGSNIDSRSSSSLGAAYDTSGLRRSVRETSLKKNLTPSTRKSEHIEKQIPTNPLVMRKSERLVEKQCFSTPSRRSERAKNQSSSSSSGSKKTGKSSGSLVMKKKHKKEKSVQQLETEEVGNSDKPVIKTVLVGIKRMDARAYRALFKQKQKKAKLEGHCEEMKDKNAKLSQGCGNNCIDGALEDVDGGDECSRREVEELIDRCILRDPEKNLEGISIVSEPTKETLESNGVLKSPPKSQRLTFIQEACQFNEGDSREDLKSDGSLVLSSHRPLSELVNNVAEMEKKKLQAELVDLISNRIPGIDTEVNNGFKVMPFKRKRSIDDLNFDAMEMVTNEDSDAASYECGRTDSVDQKKRNKVANNSTDSSSLKAALIGTSGAPVHNMSQVMPTSIGLLNTTDANHISNFTHLNSNLSQVLKANMVGYNLHDSEKSLHLFLKPEIAKLCEILQLPENVKVLVEQFLEYVLNNHHVSREPTSLLQAFLISLCWTASSMLKHKLDHKESLALAKEHLKFGCKKDEAEFVYSKLRCLKKVFLCCTGTFKVAGSPKAEDFSLKDLSKNQLNGRSSLSTPSNVQKVRMEVENLRSDQEFSIDQVLSHVGLAQKDYSKSIKCIETKCDKQMRKLLQRQQEEREKLEKKYEEEKAELERMQRTEAAVICLHRNSSPRTDTLKIVDNVYAKKFEELQWQMDMHLNNLLKLQLATRKKLQERKAQWIEGVKSWAHAELINKPPANESGYNQENTVTLSSSSKEQTPEQAQSMPDGDVPLEVPETVSLNDDVLPGVLAASKSMSGGATSSMLDQTASVRDVSEDVVSVNSSPCEEEIPDVQITLRVSEANICSDGSENTIHKSSSKEGSGRVALMMPDREFPLGVTEIVSSTGGLENDASVNPSPSEGQTSARTTSCMNGREVLLEVPETAPLEAEEAITTTMDKDGVTDMVSGNAIEEQIPDVQITLRVSEANTCSDGSENTIHKSSSEEGSGRVALMMPDGECPLRVTEIVSSTGGLENDASVNSSLSEGQTSARTISCMDGREVSLEVPETAPLEAEDTNNTTMNKDGSTGMVCGNAIEVDQQNGVVCILNPESLHDDVAAVNQQIGESLLGVPVNNVVNQQDEVVPSGVCETPCEGVGSGTPSRENSGVCVTAFSYGTGVDPQAGVLPSRGFETATGAEAGSGPTWREIDRMHAVALDSSQPTESSRLQDRGAQVCDNQIAFQQIDALASQPVVVASNQSPNDAPVTEHTLHLLPSTDSPTDSQPTTSFAQHVSIDLIAVGGPQTLNQESRQDDVAAVNQLIGESLLGAPVNIVVNRQDKVVPSGVCETPCEVAGSVTTGQENRGVCVTALSYGTGVDLQAGVLPSGGFEIATGAEVGSGPTCREIDRMHAVALDNSQPTESSRLQDRGAQVCDNRIAFQQIDASASQPVVVASNQSPDDAPVTEHTLHLLPSTDSPTGSQPITSFAQHVPIDLIAVGGPQMRISNIRTAPVTSRISNHSATVPAVRMPVSMSQDPLQNELDRIRTESDQIIKIHEDTKLRLKSDCEKEIQEVVTQIHRKYDIKLQDIESEFLRKKKEMDGNQNKVLMNKILAEAFRTKCMDNRASSTPVRQQEMTSSVVQQLLQLSQPSTQRPIVNGPYSTGLPAASLQTTPTSFPPAPPLQVAHCSALFSATPTRPPHISSISPITSNLQVGTEIRAPAPHLQHLRPSASTSATCPSSFPIGILQQVLTTPPTLSENPSLAPATVQQSGPRIATNCHESMGTLPSRTSLSRLESLMDVDNQTRTDATQQCSFPPLTDLISNINPLAPESEVVCLSDDD